MKKKLFSEFQEGVKVMVRILDGGKREVTQRLVAFSDKPELAEKTLHAWYIIRKRMLKAGCNSLKRLNLLIKIKILSTRGLQLGCENCEL
jgi:hypothetical protein